MVDKINLKLVKCLFCLNLTYNNLCAKCKAERDWVNQNMAQVFEEIKVQAAYFHKEMQRLIKK